MTKSQYQNIIQWTLANDQSLCNTDSYTVAKTIFNNCGEPFPNGDCANALNLLMSGEYMGWATCSPEQAQHAANLGIAAIGINSEQVIVIEPEHAESDVENASAEHHTCGCSCATSSAPVDEHMNMQFFARAVFGVDETGDSVVTAAATTTAPHTHSYGSWSTYTAATYTAPGTERRYCTANDGAYQSRTTSALGHSPGAAATCTTAQKCTRCGATLVAALGHNPGAAATCTSAQICTRMGCGATITPALGHNFTEPLEEYTSNHPHYQYMGCSRCSAKQASTARIYQGNYSNCTESHASLSVKHMCGSTLLTQYGLMLPIELLVNHKP